VRIGIAGITGHHAPLTSSPGDLQFDDTLQTAVRLNAALRKAGADIVVLAAHAPRAIDEELRARSGADVILSGDDHDLFIGYDGRTAFAEAMQDGLYLAAIDLDICGEDRRRRVRAGSPGGPGSASSTPPPSPPTSRSTTAWRSTRPRSPRTWSSASAPR
jgi:2',3'-cyclic-nucleotide 2'-phosphodiesterase (5'-nucleotidase family)